MSIPRCPGLLDPLVPFASQDPGLLDQGALASQDPELRFPGTFRFPGSWTQSQIPRGFPLPRIHDSNSQGHFASQDTSACASANDWVGNKVIALGRKGLLRWDAKG